jgi:BlaI family penicillinase repressor
VPKHSSQPTEFELEILQILWQLQKSPLGDIHQAVTEKRKVTYSTTRKMVQVMREKGLIECDESVRPQIYSAALPQDQTQLGLVDDLVRRAFNGSTQKLMMGLLSAERLSPDELTELQSLLKKAKRGKGS